MATIDLLYENYEKLAKATAEVDEQCDIFLSFIDATDDSDGAVRRLASQFITQFYDDFPEYHEKSIQAQIKLIAEKDGQIRRQAIKMMPQMCRDNQSIIGRVSFVITQVFESSEKMDASLATSCLLELRDINFMATLHGIFMAMQLKSNESQMFTNAVGFFCDRLMQNLTTVELSSYDMELIRVKIENVYMKLSDKNLFQMCSCLLAIPLLKPIHAGVVNILLERMGINSNFDCSEKKFMDTLKTGVDICEKAFTKSLKSNRLVEFLICDMLPKYLVTASTDGVTFTDTCQLSKLESTSPQFVDIMQSLVKILLNKYDFKGDSVQMINILIFAIEFYLPESTELTNRGHNIQTGTSFDAIECLLFTLHSMIKHCPVSNNPDVLAKLSALKNLKLTYFNKVNNYNNKQVLMGKIRGQVLTNANITAINKDLCSPKVVCKADLKPSFLDVRRKLNKKSNKGVLYKSPIGKNAKKVKAKDNADLNVSAKKYKKIVF